MASVDGEAAEREEVGTCHKSRTFLLLTMPPIAPQVGTLVLDWSIRRRCSPCRRPERNTTVHWCSDRARLHTDWYVFATFIELTATLLLDTDACDWIASTNMSQQTRPATSKPSLVTPAAKPSTQTTSCYLHGAMKLSKTFYGRSWTV